MNEKIEFSFFSKIRKKFFSDEFFFSFFGTCLENHLHSFCFAGKNCIEFFSEILFFVFKIDSVKKEIFRLKIDFRKMFFFLDSQGAMQLFF